MPMRVKKIRINRIKLAPYHPRQDLQPDDLAYQQIEGSLDELGLVEPVVWNQRTGHLVGGHQRLKILQAKGAKDIEASIVNLDPKREKILNLALNRIHGDWDEEKLSKLLAELEKEQANLALTGFSDEEIDKLIALGLADGESDEGPPPKIDQAAELQKKWKTQAGQLWAIGEHRLLCGDSTDPKAIGRLMGRKMADMIFTDPPYGVDYVGKTEHHRIQNDNLGEEGTRRLVLGAMKAWPLKPGGAFYVCSAGGTGETLFRMALGEAGYQLRQSLIWVKQHFVLGRQDYHWRHESILYGWKDGARHFFADDLTQDTIVLDENLNPAKLSRDELLNLVKEYRRREQTTVWHEHKPTVNELHPTIKPVPLVAKAIRNSTRRGEIVYDGFHGAGTTMVAAQQYQRRCFASELDPRYVAVDLERLADMGLKPKLVKA